MAAGSPSEPKSKYRVIKNFIENRYEIQVRKGWIFGGWKTIAADKPNNKTEDLEAIIAGLVRAADKLEREENLKKRKFEVIRELYQ